MKNRIIVFASLLLFTSAFLSSCNSDDDKTSIPSTPVTTSKQYKNIEAANTKINTIVENVFNTESTIKLHGNPANKMSNCMTITSEITEQNQVVVIDFGTNCEVSNGEIISGKIRMSFAVELDTESKIEINYSLENVIYNDITVSGNATTIFSIQNDTTGATRFTTNSDFSFAWGNEISATSTTNFVTESVFETNNPDTPTDLIFYTVTTGTSVTEFSNGDRYAAEITTPIRNESACQYTVSGVIVTTENTATVTLDYGDGTCDNIATQTDSDGNQTTIEL
ncbi:hypothetical protein [Aquimarina sp. I32.4]|uniref:hypothetical protein n=1 Tax=Aquimarina sp. I32.4 TaxID=2053903 RepID=UPI000CDEB732|nr:hypothetical protein [Aquimarina sp. I32.4]